MTLSVHEAHWSHLTRTCLAEAGADRDTPGEQVLHLRMLVHLRPAIHRHILEPFSESLLLTRHLEAGMKKHLAQCAELLHHFVAAIVDLRLQGLEDRQPLLLRPWPCHPQGQHNMPQQCLPPDRPVLMWMFQD